MRVGLIDVDGRNFPNLALMKISAYHKANGDSVSWYNNLCEYDKVYMSKVFTFSPDYGYYVNAKEVVRGGTGYDVNVKLPEEIGWITEVDYSIYPKYKEAYGFLTRGCIRRCEWCIVPQKEGNILPNDYIEDVLQDRASAVLMDNNVLASHFGLRQIEKIASLGCKVDFNQGLDVRLITDDIAELLSQVKWIRYIRFALDSMAALTPLINALKMLNKHGVGNSKIFVYVLLQELNDSYDRINICKTLGVNPFAQPYRDFTPNQVIPQWQKDMARWCNRKEILKSTDFKDYSPRKGFKCSAYFNK